MAATCSNNLVGFLLLCILAAGTVCDAVSSHRVFPYAFENRRFPHGMMPSSTDHGEPCILEVGGTAIQRHAFHLAPLSAIRHLLGSESPAGSIPTGTPAESPSNSGIYAGSRHSTISKKWLLIIILMPAVLLVWSIVLFLLWTCKGKKSTHSSLGMLVWTNQSTLQHHLEADLSSESSRSKKCEPWLSHLHKADGCVKKGGGGGGGGGGVPETPCSLSYPVLQAATNNFSSSNLLGEGSFGHVYKARLDYGVFAAVKRLTKVADTEFQAEVDLMSRIRHPSLVALLGFSTDGPEPLLVYELMQNGSLYDQLHGPSQGAALTWHLRLKIALEAARGLEHLHENCKPAIIHRDFKASNILLDASFNAKVCDFGLALAVNEGSSQKDDLQVKGTFGYVAPEYLMDGTLTEKSDVYGFGVVLLELLTGRLPVDASLPPESQSLVSWATPQLTDRAKVLEILDPCLQETASVKHLHQIAAVAALCVQPEPSYRPLIADVVQSLVPLVPHELGGALRDHKASVPVGNNKKLTDLEICDDCYLTDPDEQSYSKRSDYSFISLEEPISKSSELGIDIHDQFWKPQ